VRKAAPKQQQKENCSAKMAKSQQNNFNYGNCFSQMQ
jgi:hypothetical protein